MQRIAHVQSGIENNLTNNHYDCCIELLRILKRKGVPLCVFDKIMQWANKSVKYKKYDFGHDTYTRKSLIQNLFTRYNLHGMKPQKVTLKLPSNDMEVQIVIHNVKQCLYSILCDPFLNQDKKYYFKQFNTPKVPLNCDNRTIKDFYNARSFKDAENKFLTGNSKEIIVPICFFIDKTHCTKNGQFTCEPVSICLMMYDVQTCNLPQAWRTLGYIINQADSEKKNCTPHSKLVDYHECLSIILQPFHRMQLENGFQWRIPYKGQVFDVIIKTPVLFIAGDNEGLDKLAGRYGSCSNNVQCICCYCDIPLQESGSISYKYNYLTNKQMVKMVERGNKEGLKQLSHHLVKNNILHELIFCNSH